MAVTIKLPSIGEVLATRARAVFPYRINFQTIRLDSIEEMKTWCHDNCKSLWRCESYHALYFQFEDDYDATMFMLRWATAEGNEIK